MEHREPAVRRLIPSLVCLRQPVRTMNHIKTKNFAGWKLAMVAIWPVVTMLTGCQVEMAGQTLPSPWYLTDDVQYYAPGPEFKLAREAAAMKEQAEAVKSQSQSAPVQ